MALSTLGGLWVQAPNSSGSALWDVSGTEIWEVLASAYGLALMARLAIVVLAASVLPPLLRGEAGQTQAAVDAVHVVE